jgi:hypothetical protein
VQFAAAGDSPRRVGGDVGIPTRVLRRAPTECFGNPIDTRVIREETPDLSAKTETVRFTGRLVMSIRRLAAAMLVTLGGFVMLSPSAEAAPPTAQPDGTYVCSNGQSYFVFVNEHSLVGYVDGRGVAPRAFRFTSHLSLVVQDGPYAGDVISADVDSGVTGPNEQPIRSPLVGTSTCVQTSSDQVEFTIDQETVDFFGIDPKYLGFTVIGTEDASITVWVTTQLLQHR